MTSSPARAFIATLVAALLLLAPARGTTESEAAAPQGAIKRLTVKVREKVQSVEDAATRFARYARNAAKMRTFHESVPLDSAPLLDLLHQRGVGRHGAPPPRSKAAPRANFPVTTYGGGFSWPVEVGIISSEYGPRWGKLHAGIDIAADVGEPVYATAPGVVIYSGNGLSGYGNLVIIRHDQAVTTLYAHNSRLDVREGDSVKQGARIAKVGSTGHSTGPHLHFEIRDLDRPVNPRTKLAANKYIGK